MIDWQSPAMLRKENVAFTDILHVLLGLYAWEFCNTLDFEWDFITRKKRFRWPLIFYFGGRYSLIFLLIGMAIAVDITYPIKCQALYTVNALTGSSALGFASINLAIRTIAVWFENRTIIIILVILILGHWAVIFHGILITADWSPAIGTCVITHISNASVAAIYIYSMAFDGIVLALNAYKLLRTGLVLKRATEVDTTSKLGRLIFTDGLIYFIISFLSNLVATVFMILNMSQLMNVMFSIPAAVISTIVASRAVRRLSNFGKRNPTPLETQPSRFGNSNHGRHGDGHVPTIGPISTGLGTTGGKSACEVHVKMDKFTHTDEMLGDEAPDRDGRKWGSVV